MMRRCFCGTAAAVFLVLGAGPIFADLEEIKEDTNLQRRSRKALENADAVLDKAREAYRKGDGSTMDQAFQEIIASVELAYQALVERGRDPRKNAQPYKRGEIKTRELLRRLTTFREEMSYMDRDRIASVIEAVDKIHGNFLRDVMGGRQ
jgi:hypothetical protein